MEQSAGSTRSMWHFTLRALICDSFLPGTFILPWRFGFLSDSVTKASERHVIIVLAEGNVFVLARSPFVRWFPLLLLCLRLVGTNLYLASELLISKESSKIQLFHLSRECWLQGASSTRTCSRTFVSLKMRNMLLKF